MNIELTQRLVNAIEGLINTGLNGGNNVRLAFLAAKQLALSDDDLARAELSEQALNEACAALEQARSARTGHGNEMTMAKKNDWSRAFTQGYACAVATLIRLDGPTAVAIELFKASISTVAAAEQAGVDEHDLEVFRQHKDTLER